MTNQRGNSLADILVLIAFTLWLAFTIYLIL